MINWDDLIGHDRVRGWIEAALKQNRLSGSFLFVGPPGVGKRTVATLLARTLLCPNAEPHELSPCGHCESCQQVVAGSHPDVVRVRKPDNRASIPIDLLIGPPEARMQEGFCRDLRLRPQYGRRKVAILEDADDLAEEAANCLLKTLEEPPRDAIVILIGTNEQKQLPTIRSRCQTVRLGPLAYTDAVSLIRQDEEIDADETRIQPIIAETGGDLRMAKSILKGHESEIRDKILQMIGEAIPDPVKLTRVILDGANSAGKEAPKRRAAIHRMLSVCVSHFRHRMRQEVEQNSQCSKLTLNRLDRSMRAVREIHRMANQQTLIECFAADLALGRTGDRGDIGS